MFSLQRPDRTSTNFQAESVLLFDCVAFVEVASGATWLGRSNRFGVLQGARCGSLATASRISRTFGFCPVHVTRTSWSDGSTTLCANNKHRQTRGKDEQSGRHASQSVDGKESSACGRTLVRTSRRSFLSSCATTCLARSWRLDSVRSWPNIALLSSTPFHADFIEE